MFKLNINLLLLCLINIFVLSFLLIAFIFYFKLNESYLDSISANHQANFNYLNAKELFSANNIASSYFSEKDIQNVADYPLQSENTTQECTMSKCFDFERCKEEKFKIYIYNESLSFSQFSNIYKKIIDSLLNSNYITRDPAEACLFILPFDTLDRDRLSSNFVKDLNQLISNLEHWNSGKNHLIFNLYSGSYPNYVENLEIDAKYALIAKASFSVKYYRKNFDVAFPLFHTDLPFNSSYVQPVKDSLFNSKKYLLTFKGKRYLHGIGSETRNSVYHLNNNRDILLLTTCKHGKEWIYLKDERCDVDISLYEK